MSRKDAVVDYLDAVARFDREERASRDTGSGDVLLPEAAGEQVVDYLAVSREWKDVRGVLVNNRE